MACRRRKCRWCCGAATPPARPASPAGLSRGVRARADGPLGWPPSARARYRRLEARLVLTQSVQPLHWAQRHWQATPGCGIEVRLRMSRAGACAAGLGRARPQVHPRSWARSTLGARRDSSRRASQQAARRAPGGDSEGVPEDVWECHGGCLCWVSKWRERRATLCGATGFRAGVLVPRASWGFLDLLR
jgi:hypothetical protein